MEKTCQGICPFYTQKLNGTMEGEKKFKFRAVLGGSSRIAACLCRLEYAFAGFGGYTRNERGEIDGAVILCDLGQGYGFDDGEEKVTLRANETHSFVHSHTDTSGGTWDNDSVKVTLTLIPFDEEECSWTAVQK